MYLNGEVQKVPMFLSVTIEVIAKINGKKHDSGNFPDTKRKIPIIRETISIIYMMNV